VKFASSVAVSERKQGTKTFSAAEFRRVMRSANFIGAVTFWRALEHLADPEPRTRLHAMGVLAELARGSFAAAQRWFTRRSRPSALNIAD